MPPFTFSIDSETACKQRGNSFDRREWKIYSQICMAPVRCIACDSLGNRGEKRAWETSGELNRVHMSPKARVSPSRESACISGVHPYADPHWYDNIYILHIRSGPYTRIANSPLLAFGHQCVWLTLLVAPLTPDYISICIHSRTSLSPPACLRVARSRSNIPLSFCVFVRVDDWTTILSSNSFRACHIFARGVQVR